MSEPQGLGIDDEVWVPTVFSKNRDRLLDGGYAISQRCRKKIEQGFGWGKSIGLLRKLRHRGNERVDWVFTFTVAVYDMVRIRTLMKVGVSP